MSKQSQGRPTKAPPDIKGRKQSSDLQKPRYSSGSTLRVRLAVEIGSLAQAARYGEARPRLLAMLLAQQERWRIPEARALCSCAAIGQELCPILPSRTTQPVGCDLRHTGRRCGGPSPETDVTHPECHIGATLTGGRGRCNNIAPSRGVLGSFAVVRFVEPLVRGKGRISA
jgi:hypothetical protein